MAITNDTPLQVTIYPTGFGPPAASASAPASTNQGQFWTGEGPTFKDVLDTINPLQHIPLVSTLYQSLTGDTQSTGAKLAGGALFGGPIGFVGSLLDSIYQSATGSDIGTTLIATIEGKSLPATPNAPSNATTEVAENSEPAFLSANQRAAYNSYVHTQTMMA